MATLRGAPVEVDARRVRQVIEVLIAMTLAVLSVTFFISGVHHNSDVSNLKHHGVSVNVTVITCAGELGGSGSNLADYRCEGSFHLNGQRYESTIPGHGFRKSGSISTFVTAANAPGQLATFRGLRHENTSSSVFILPSALLLALLGVVGFVTRRHARRDN